MIYEKKEMEKNKINFEKSKNSAINYEDILASVAPNLPASASSKSKDPKPSDFNKYFLSKTNYTKLMNAALGSFFTILNIYIFLTKLKKTSRPKRTKKKPLNPNQSPPSK